MDLPNIIADSPQAETANPRNRVNLWSRMKFMVVRGFLYGWARCFSLKGLYWFGQFFGFCEWALNYNRRGRFHKRLRQLMGDAYDANDPKIRRACLEHFTRTRCDKLLYLIFDKLPRQKILNRIKFHNRQLLDDALAQDKGAYCSLSHFGSHHVLILLMALMGYKVAGVRDRNEGALRRYVQQKYEETFPEFRDIRMFFSDTYPRDLYRCLREGYILGTALDVGRPRGTHLKTIPVTLFGQQKEFLTGTMQIALRVGSPIMQGFVVSDRNFYFHLIVKELNVPRDEGKDETTILAEVMQQYADNIAAHVTEYPSHVSKS